MPKIFPKTTNKMGAAAEDTIFLWTLAGKPGGVGGIRPFQAFLEPLAEASDARKGISRKCLPGPLYLKASEPVRHSNHHSRKDLRRPKPRSNPFAQRTLE